MHIMVQFVACGNTGCRNNGCLTACGYKPDHQIAAGVGQIQVSCRIHIDLTAAAVRHQGECTAVVDVDVPAGSYLSGTIDVGIDITLVGAYCSAGRQRCSIAGGDILPGLVFSPNVIYGPRSSKGLPCRRPR